MTGPITWDLISLLVIFGGAVLGIWWRIERRIEKAEAAAERQVSIALKKNEDRADEIIAVAKDLSDYKLSAAQKFASHDHLKEVEVRLTGAIDRLTNRIEQLPTKFAEEVARIVSVNDRPSRR